MEKVVVKTYFNERTYLKDAKKMEKQGYIIMTIEGRQNGGFLGLRAGRLVVTYVYEA